MHEKSIQFVRNGQIVQIQGLDPNTTLLELLRDRLSCVGTKEGCGEGDCGACTVVLADTSGTKLNYQAINSCIRTAHSVDGLALWTVEDLTTDPLLQPAPAPFQAQPATPAQGVIKLHPVQQAMVNAHASQCGFCTPGFVMSLFALYQNTQQGAQPVSRPMAQQALSGNLCRCTGYRPILEAACDMGQHPKVTVDERRLKSLLKQAKATPNPSPSGHYLQPTTLAGLLSARAKYPAAQLVAGCTDVGLWITKMHKQFDRIIDLTRVQELATIENYPHHIAIGAAASLESAFTALQKSRPQLAEFAQRFAGLPVRNSGTLGGNVANGSPIGDSMPLLIALGANVVLSAWRRGKIHHREMPLENLYTGYRTNVMKTDEVLTWIKVPKPTKGEYLRVYKVSKRFDDDISAVCLALRLQIKGSAVTQASIGVGGVAATPVRAVKTEAALTGQTWRAALAQQAGQVLTQEFSPISDMRASGAYRRTVLEHLLQRYWQESQPTGTPNSVFSPELEALAGEIQ
jgi:xanthine dehydrogenase small subunit